MRKVKVEYDNGSNPATPTTLTLSKVENPQILWICGFFVLFHIKKGSYRNPKEWGSYRKFGGNRFLSIQFHHSVQEECCV
ncbi:hypothetical protein, partial [Sphingobacterium hotanense]|uniref:hypothetical protein n=1 Tax=Sphingobacterium hotanense TaxID=649196 RepID=UPI0025781E1A